jgi:hypothetical protein
MMWRPSQNIHFHLYTNASEAMFSAKEAQIELLEAQLEVREVENDMLRLVCAQAVKCEADAWQSHAEVVGPWRRNCARLLAKLCL